MVVSMRIFAAMKPQHALFALGVILLLLSTAGTVLTAYSILRDGFMAVQSVSVFQTLVRLTAIAIALSLWRFARTPVEKVALLCWLVAAGSSALHYGLGWNNAGLQVVRSVSHLFAYSVSTAALLRLLVDFRAGHIRSSAFSTTFR
jgi:hypothetical protein